MKGCWTFILGKYFLVTLSFVLIGFLSKVLCSQIDYTKSFNATSKQLLTQMLGSNKFFASFFWSETQNNIRTPTEYIYLWQENSKVCRRWVLFVGQVSCYEIPILMVGWALSFCIIPIVLVLNTKIQICDVNHTADSPTEHWNFIHVEADNKCCVCIWEVLKSCYCIIA